MSVLTQFKELASRQDAEYHRRYRAEEKAKQNKEDDRVRAWLKKIVGQCGLDGVGRFSDDGLFFQVEDVTLGLLRRFIGIDRSHFSLLVKKGGHQVEIEVNPCDGFTPAHFGFTVLTLERKCR